MNANIYSEKCIASIRKHLDRSEHKYITYPKFIFLCGKGFDKSVEDSYWNTNRGIIHRYMEKLLPDINVVLSEQLWEDGFDSKIDLLTFEEFLAEVSDAIILFVESPGSFCELGAFAYADSLFSDKMIVVLDDASALGIDHGAQCRLVMSIGQCNALFHILRQNIGFDFLKGCKHTFFLPVCRIITID